MHPVASRIQTMLRESEESEYIHTGQACELLLEAYYALGGKGPEPSPPDAGHTPTPWRRESGVVVGGEGEAVAEVFGEADAAFIVRSANAHRQLLTALAAWFEWYRTLPDVRGGETPMPPGTYNKARNALAVARGRSRVR